MRKVKAYVTVYLALITGIVIVLIFTVIRMVRQQTIRMETECVMDAGLSSIFAEYHREMLKQYGLLFIDCSYGKTGNTDNTKTHLLSYLNMNFTSNDYLYDITKTNADNCSLSKVSFASDNHGEVLRYQISQYMKTKNGIGLFDNSNLNLIDGYEEEYDQYDEKRTAIEGEIDEIVEEYNATLSEDEEPVGVSNPADSVERLSSSSALFYACRDLSSISTNVAQLNHIYSNRQHTQGYGLYSNQDSPDGVMDRTLYMNYLFDKLAYKDKTKDNACLNYQLEYLIAGKAGDIDNLEVVAEKIFKTRYLVNIQHLYQSPVKQNQALELATASTAIIAQPELTEAVKQAILLAWAYAESAKDMRILFDGNKLSLVKTEEQWNTPIEQIVDFRHHLDEYRVIGGSLDYKGYITGFLLLQNLDKQNERLMDIMEMDIRITPANANFCMDNLIYQLYADVNVSSKYGYGCSINRGFSYR